MKAYSSRTPWQSTRRPFKNVSLFGHPLEFGAQTTQFGMLIVFLLPLFLGLAVAHDPGIQAMHRHAQPRRYLSNGEATLGH